LNQAENDNEHFFCKNQRFRRRKNYQIKTLIKFQEYRNITFSSLL
jgi:hypothetical protein